MASSCRQWTIHPLPDEKVALCFCLLSTIVPVLRLTRVSRETNLRTIIVIADIHRGLYGPAQYRSTVPPMLDLPALVRCHPLYILLRVRRELCFW